MKVVAIAQARMGSTRVPGKVMRPLNNRPVLHWVVDALYHSDGIDRIVLATSKLEADDIIADYCKRQSIECFRGDEVDVLSRYYHCARQYRADVVLRLTCDCPFLDPHVISEVVKGREVTGVDYCSNVNPPTYPDGLDVEAFTFEALETAWKEAKRPTDRDTVTQYIVRNKRMFSSSNVVCPIPTLVNERWVLDTEKDWEFCNRLAPHVLRKDYPTSYLAVLRALEIFPDIREINAGGIRNERFLEQLAQEEGKYE